jgi:subtilisin family serine protease
MSSKWLALVITGWLAAAAWAQPVLGRYIVELTAEPAIVRTGDFLRSAAATGRRERVRRDQSLIRQRIEARQAKVLGAVETVANAMFVEMTGDEAARLRATPGVRRVVQARKVKMLLDHAVSLHHVVEAWNRIGVDHAGDGVKIAIIDSGVDAQHPALQDSTLAAPPGFPRFNADSDASFTSGKVIVARSYVNLLPSRDPDRSARDRSGHGTALATAAAGVRVQAPLTTVTGVAPRAWIGSYKVFGTPGFNDTTTDDVIIKAIDDAVNDGMDVINLSLGSEFAPRLEDDIEVQAVERAARAGVIVVAAAGNNGPDYSTLSSPATAPSAIAVGATTNERTFGVRVEVDGLAPVPARLSDGPRPDGVVEGALADVAALDSTGLACASLPARSLQGAIALILRGTCTFEAKLDNVQRAGAAGALVYAAADSPDPISMAVGAATLPAQMISHQDGLALKQAGPVVAKLRFTQIEVATSPDQLTSFSSAGPNVNAGIKPDLMAVGESVYVATQSFDPNGDMYSANGYTLVNGTSFSAPIVAGAAALVKGARPGLSVDQYRSLLINSAAAIDARIQQSGAGVLNVDTALAANVTLSPVSLTLGSGGNSVETARTLTLTNIGTIDESLSIAGRGGPLLLVAEPNTLVLAPGASAEVKLTFTGSDLAPGAQEGFVQVLSATTGAVMSVPYWYAVSNNQPAGITILSTVQTARRGARQVDAVLFRVIDAAGLPLPEASVTVTSTAGGGVARGVRSYDAEIPGLLGLEVQLGIAAGANIFQIETGGITREVTITGR